MPWCRPSRGFDWSAQPAQRKMENIEWLQLTSSSLSRWSMAPVALSLLQRLRHQRPVSGCRPPWPASSSCARSACSASSTCLPPYAVCGAPQAYGTAIPPLHLPVRSCGFQDSPACAVRTVRKHSSHVAVSRGGPWGYPPGHRLSSWQAGDQPLLPPALASACLSWWRS